MAHYWTLTSLLLVVLWTTSSCYGLGESVEITSSHNGTEEVLDGNHISFNCVGPGYLSWYHNDALLKLSPADGITIITWISSTPEKTYTNSKLTMGPVTLKYDGFIVCKNEDGQEDRVRLYVTGGLVRIKGYVEEEDGRLWIECRAAQGTSLEWLKDGKLVSTTEPGVGILTQEDREKGEAVSTLMVDMQTEYEGQYTCRDVNSPSTLDTATILQPTTPATTPAPRRRIAISRDDFNVTEGEFISIECRGNMNASLFWTHNHARLLPGHDVIMMTSMTTTGEQVTSLGILSASIRWAGNYSCMDHMDLTNQDSVHVTVLRNTSADRVRITTDKSIQATPGGEFSIRCEAGPSAALFWTHDDLPVVRVQQDGDLVVMTTMTTSGKQVTTVTVTSVNQRRAGVYACRDYNDDTNSDSVTVSVQPDKVGAAVRILSPGVDVNVEEGEPFTLICAGAASTRPTWYLNDQPLGYQPNLLVTNTIDFITLDLVVILTRLSPDTSASGVYSCRDMGNGEETVQRRVTVNSKEAG